MVFSHKAQRSGREPPKPSSVCIRHAMAHSRPTIIQADYHLLNLCHSFQPDRSEPLEKGSGGHPNKKGDTLARAQTEKLYYYQNNVKQT